VGAGLAEGLAIEGGLAVVVDTFAALGAGDARGFVAGHLAGVEGNLDPLLREEIGVGEFAVGEHLLLVLVFDVRVALAGTGLGGFEGGDADGFVSGCEGVFYGGAEYGGAEYGGCEVEEGGGHLAPVADLEGALAEAAAGDHSNSVGGAAINLYKGDEAFAVFWRVDAAWVFYAETLEGEQCHADTEDLAGAKVAVGDLCVFEESFELKGGEWKLGGGHGLMIRLCGVACVLCWSGWAETIAWADWVERRGMRFWLEWSGEVSLRETDCGE
jgi:hypothetical protein